MKNYIIATHGEMAAGIKDALKLIVGDAADSVTAYTLKPGQNADTFASEVRELAMNKKDEQFVVMVDLYGASVFNSFASITDLENVYLFAGVNLGLALSLVLDPNPLDNEKAKSVIEDIKESLLYFEGVTSEEDDDNFFD